MKISVFIAMSLDGFIAGENDELDWLRAVESKDEDYGYKKFFSTVDAILLGRNTYEKIIKFESWPYHEKTCYIATNRPLHPLYNEKSVSGSPDEIFQFLKQNNHRHIYLDGGKLIHSFLEKKQIDEMTISVIPLLLGRGIPLFSKHEHIINLSLQRAKSFPSGLTQLCYKVIK